MGFILSIFLEAISNGFRTHVQYVFNICSEEDIDGIDAVSNPGPVDNLDNSRYFNYFYLKYSSFIKTQLSKFSFIENKHFLLIVSVHLVALTD